MWGAKLAEGLGFRSDGARAGAPISGGALTVLPWTEFRDVVDPKRSLSISSGIALRRRAPKSASFLPGSATGFAILRPGGYEYDRVIDPGC